MYVIFGGMSAQSLCLLLHWVLLLLNYNIFIYCRHSTQLHNLQAFLHSLQTSVFNYFSHSLDVLKKTLLDPKLKRAQSLFSSVDFDVLGLLFKLRLCFELVVWMV